MKKIILIVLSNIIMFTAIAQQEVQVSQYIINPYFVNPSYVALADYFQTNASYRTQWVGLEGAPETFMLTSQTTLGKPHWGRTHPGDWHGWHGIGGGLVSDKIGAYSKTKVQMSYAYNLRLTQGEKYGYHHKDGLRIVLGVSGGWNQYRVDQDILGMKKNSSLGNQINTSILSDPVYQRLGVTQRAAVDMSVGGMLYYSETYFLGISTSHVFESKANLTEQSRFARHYFISGKIKSKISEKMYIIPSFLMKAVVGAPLSVDLGTRFDWDDKYYLGVGYRHQDALTLMLGYRLKWGEKVKNFRVDKHRYIMQFYYSYDITTSKLGSKELTNRSTGSHEITVGFLLPPMFKERNAEDTW